MQGCRTLAGNENVIGADQERQRATSFKTGQVLAVAIASTERGRRWKPRLSRKPGNTGVVQKLTDKELKKELASPQGQMKFVFTGLVFLAIAGVVLLVLLVDPLGLFDGPPAVREAKKWLALSICFIWLPVLAGIWFLVIRPLQTGILARGSKYRAPYLVLRSEEPGRFKGHIIWNCVLLTAGVILAACMLASSVRDLQKAKTGSERESDKELVDESKT